MATTETDRSHWCVTSIVAALLVSPAFFDATPSAFGPAAALRAGAIILPPPPVVPPPVVPGRPVPIFPAPPPDAPPCKEMRMADVIDRDPDAAVAQLHEMGLEVEVRDVGNGSGLPIVVRQFPQPGAVVCVGQTVTIYVDGAPVETTTTSEPEPPTTESTSTTGADTNDPPTTDATSSTSSRSTGDVGSSSSAGSTESTSSGSSDSTAGDSATSSGTSTTATTVGPGSTSSSDVSTGSSGSGTTSGPPTSGSPTSDPAMSREATDGPRPGTRPPADGWPVLAVAGLMAVGGVAGVRRARRRIALGSRPLEVLLVPGSLESTIGADSFGGQPLRFHLQSDASVEYVESDPPPGGIGGSDER